MTTSFPGGLDNFTNPAGTSLLTNPDHAGQHTDLNDAVEALEAKVGVDGSLVTTSLDYKFTNDVVLKTLVDAKGDLITATADNTPARLAVGTDDQVLMARASEATGLAYGAPRLAGGAALPLLTGGARLSGSGLVVTGLSSNNASSPDSAALDITGDIDIKVYVACADWTPAIEQYFVAKFGAAGQRSLLFSLRPDGTLRLYTYADGTNDVTGTSSVATGIADGATKWVRATLDVDNGASQRVYKFYTSDDGSTWTQLGSTQTVAGTTSIFNSTAALVTGGLGSTGGFTSGTFFRTIIQSGFDNVNNTNNLAYDANFETATADALAFTETANSATVTINTTRYTAGLPGVGFVSVGTRSVTANSDHLTPFFVTAPTTVYGWAFEVTTAPASTSTAHFGLFAADNDLQPTGSAIVATSTTAATSTTGVRYIDFTPTTLQPGNYIVCLCNTVAFTLRAYQSATPVFHTLGNGLYRVITNSQTAAAFTTARLWTSRTGGAFGLDAFLLLRYTAA